MNNEVYSLVFERDGEKFSIHVIADKRTAEFFADSLGLEMPQQVTAIVPELDWAN